MEKYKKDDLERFILIENKSYIDIGKLYGVSDSYIRRKAKALGVELPERNHILPFAKDKWEDVISSDQITFLHFLAYSCSNLV